MTRHPAGTFEAFTAAETLRTYLPQTIEAYLAVPAGYRRERRAGQPSADDELRTQLTTLASGLMRIMDADAAAGFSRLSANGAFLNERFGSAPAPQRLGPAQALRRALRAKFAEGFADFIRR
jgi:hypothetical protein